MLGVQRRHSLALGLPQIGVGAGPHRGIEALTGGLLVLRGPGRAGLRVAWRRVIVGRRWGRLPWRIAPDEWSAGPRLRLGIHLLSFLPCELRNLSFYYIVNRRPWPTLDLT